MKATLEFDLDDPSDRREFEMASNARKLQFVVSDLGREMRDEEKYHGDKSAAKWRERLQGCIRDNDAEHLFTDVF